MATMCKFAAKSRSSYKKLLHEDDDDEEYNNFVFVHKKQGNNKNNTSSNNNNNKFAKMNDEGTKNIPRKRTGVKRMMRMRKRWIRGMGIRRRKLRLNWFSPFEIFRKLRQAYIQAVLRENSDPGSSTKLGFVVASHWSFPIVIPFHVGAAVVH